jgi:pimeloyl-ACP methyl ester carboxylesterase
VNELLGLAQLLLLAVIAALLILSAVIARDAVRPPRRAAGYAVARGLPADPGDLGLEFDAWTLDRPDGAALPVWEAAAPGSPHAGHPAPTAVFVHDWGESRIDALAWIRPWDELCGRLVFYDLRGHGDATGGSSRLGHREEQDLLALVGRLGDGPFVLVGHALGGRIALAAAAAAPPEAGIAGVVTLGPAAAFRETLRGRLRAASLPARPLAGLALAWLWLAGIRRDGPDRPGPPPGMPVLAAGAADEISTDGARAFLSRLARIIHEAPSSV